MSFRFSEFELRGGFDPVRERALNGGYERLAAATAEAVAHGRQGAFDVLATQVVVDATHSLLSQPGVAERLPQEVGRRTSVAVDGAYVAASVLATTWTLVGVYFNHKPLRKLMGPDDQSALTDEDYIGSLGASAFSDVRFAAGGAHRFLRQRRGTDGPFTDTIVNSTGLLMVSGIARRHARRVWREMGYPYFLPRFFDLTQGDVESQEVIFTPEARGIIKGASDPSGGCPAGHIRSPESNVQATVLTEAWGRIVRLLVPEDATTKERNTKPPAAVE